MVYHPFRSLGRYVMAACAVSLVAVSLSAQKPATASVSGSNPSRADIFLGSTYFSAHGTLQPAGIPYTSISQGAIGSYAYYFNKHSLNQHLGFEGVYTNNVVNHASPSDGAVGISGGPIYRLSPVNNITFFVHGLFGAEQLTGPNSKYPPATAEYEPAKWGFGLTAGGGMDIAMPFCNHLSLRLFEVDYRYSHVNFGPYAGLPTSAPVALGGTTDLNAIELSTGIVVHFGHM